MDIRSPHLEALLAAHQSQGQTNDCGPYTTAIVLRALRGIEIPGADLARRMNRPRRRGALLVVRRIPRWATFPWGVADILREHGLDARWRLWTSEVALRRALPTGEVLLPIIGEWFPRPWAHISVLVAWNATRGWGFVDPATSRPVLRWQPAEEFSRQWRAYCRPVVRVWKDEL